MLTRHVPLTIAALALSLSAASASAISMNYTKITWEYKTRGDDSVINVDGSIGPDAASPPALEFLQGLGVSNNPTTNSPPTQRRLPVHNLGSSGQDGVDLQFIDDPTNPQPFPAISFFDIFTEISLPTAGGDPSSNPTSLRKLEVHNLGSSGQDGVVLKLDYTVTIQGTGEELPMESLLSIPVGQGFTFHSADPSFAADPSSPGDPTRFSSFFDIFVELDVSGPFNSGLPVMELRTTILPEPTSLALLACAAPLLLRRRK